MGLNLSHLCILAAGGFLAIAAIGLLYSIAALFLVRRLGKSRYRADRNIPSVTILKPLHGAEPQLYDNVASFCRQDYAGNVQIVCGVQDRDDPAAAVARQLIADFPQIKFNLVIDPRLHGANRKVGNLINMVPFAANEVVIISDCDVQVGGDYLSHVTDALAEPGVGLVTCLYRGTDDPHFAAKLASMATDYHFLPSVLVGLKLGLARPCFGSTMALRHEMLQRIGGLQAFADILADDNAIGEAVRRTGAKVAIPSIVVCHDFRPQRASDVLHQELRWARTIRGIAPGGYVGSIITHPLPMALLALLIGDFDSYGVPIVAIILACRLALQREIDSAIGSKASRLYLGPLGDLMSFGIFLASFFVARIRWRGHQYRVHANGTISEMNVMTG